MVLKELEQQSAATPPLAKPVASEDSEGSFEIFGHVPITRSCPPTRRPALSVAHTVIPPPRSGASLTTAGNRAPDRR